jgi:hypothetical protein
MALKVTGSDGNTVAPTPARVAKRATSESARPADVSNGRSCRGRRRERPGKTLREVLLCLSIAPTKETLRKTFYSGSACWTWPEEVLCLPRPPPP